MIGKQEALDYHSHGRKGKIEVVPSKPCATQRDLSLAYTPGVAEPCLEIEKNPELAYSYTAKGNLVAVVSNGTAVLGLGDIGAQAGKPVMEGKGVLFKRFADIDVFDIELATHDPDEIVRTVQLLEPTFGGINLEDIKAPECFYIEEKLRETMGIPVFHDDQHGTAIISAAALLNALELTGRRIENVRAVFSGAGAAGIACARLYERLGMRRENMLLVDTKGVVYEGRREGMNPYKAHFATKRSERTLQEAMRGADIFCGVSVKGLVTPEMVRSMADRPILFALANPDPEIPYDEAKAARPDALVATGRSDFPNQVNNVLGFPFIFRGALDVRAKAINEEMKIAAAKALASLAKEDVPESVMRAYGVRKLEFGPEYLIPKPFDHRVLFSVATAVAKAAMATEVARAPIRDFEAYRDALEARLGRSREVMRFFVHKAQSSPKRVVFPEGEEDKILHAADIVSDEGIAHPVLIGNAGRIAAKAEHLGISLQGIEIVDPKTSPRREAYAHEWFELRQRRGVTREVAERDLRETTRFGMMMVRLGDADGLIAGVVRQYSETIRPALEVIGKRDDVARIAGMYMLVFKSQTLFLADATVNVEPTAEDLADIAILAGEKVRDLHIAPKVAMLSFSNFGSTQHPLVTKVRRAVEIARERAPWLVIDGEMRADTALCGDVLAERYPFSRVQGGANVLICPDLTSANIAYKLLGCVGGASAIGPILLGIKKPVYLLSPEQDVSDIVNMTAIAVFEAQRLLENGNAK